MTKTFKDTVRAKQAAENPALQFFSQPNTEEDPPEGGRDPEDRDLSQMTEETASPEPIKEGHRTTNTPKGREARTRRLQLLLTPSLYEAVKAKAEKERRSINDLICIILEDETKGDI